MSALDFPSSPRARWRMTVAYLASARRDAGVMRDPDQTQQVRDLATQRYTRTIDKLLATLGEMNDAGHLHGVGEMLDVTFGRP